ncbi:MAG: lipopolysaccharide biosynthesis protein [Planctomycetales bacterium]|nr:lipopolysaccharide biosynthesis protein [Planctomycetales bacterium]
MISRDADTIDNGNEAVEVAGHLGCTAPDTRSHRLASQFLATVVVSFSIVGMQVVQGILLARILGPVGRGEYATAVFFVQLLLYIGLFGGLEVICRHAAHAELDVDQLRRAALKLGLVTGGVTTIIAMGLSVWSLPAEKQFLIPMALLCALSITGQQVVLVMTAIDRGRGRFGNYNLRRVIAASSFPVLLLAAQLAIGVTLRSVCVLFVIASIVSMAACLTGLPKPIAGISDPKVGRLLRDGRPYALSTFATDVFERLDLMLILWIAGLQDQGYYAAMLPVVYPLLIIPNTMGLFLFNAGADHRKRLAVRDVHRILGACIAVQAICTIVFMVLVGTVVEWFYGVEFIPAVPLAMWLAPVAAIRGILQGLESYVKGRGKPLVAVKCRVAAMVVMLVVTFLLHPHYGPVSVAMAALAGQMLCLVWMSALVYADIGGRVEMETVG